ncbi:MAG: hypothetical protein U5K28_12940 [Halobacteriales archaeon]|nr:hypothetical protein [Halobacteriales archaeon]
MNWVDTIADWQTRPVEDGYAGLHDLADAGFSGGVSTDDTWLLFVNGTAVSVTDHSDGSPTPGDIERFEDAPLAAHEAPHPSVPLLAAMQFGDSETRGKYYTEETPLSEVETTLDDGGFTGYVELSENVLSGDYYTVYQGGQSTHIAFVGNSSSLKTDDDAREAAHDEVGLYEVVAAPIGVVELPDAPEPDEEPEPTTVATPADAAASEESDIDSEPSDTQSEPDTPTETPVEAEEEPESNVDDSVATESDEEVATDEPTADESATDEPTTATDSTVAESDDESTDVPPEPTATSDVEKEATTTAVSESTMDSESTDSGARSPSSAISRVSEPDEESTSDEPDEEPTSDELHAGASASNASSSSPPSKTTSVTEQLAARSIPSVDPERTTDHSDQTKPSRPSHTSRQRQPRKQQSTREQADTQTRVRDARRGQRGAGSRS